MRGQEADKRADVQHDGPCVACRRQTYSLHLFSLRRLLFAVHSALPTLSSSPVQRLSPSIPRGPSRPSSFFSSHTRKFVHSSFSPCLPPKSTTFSLPRARRKLHLSPLRRLSPQTQRRKRKQRKSASRHRNNHLHQPPLQNESATVTSPTINISRSAESQKPCLTRP